MRNNTHATVEAVVRKTLGISQFPATFTSDAPLNSLGIDSILLLEIIVALEAELGIEIADEALNALLLSSINGLVTLVDSQQTRRTGE